MTDLAMKFQAQLLDEHGSLTHHISLHRPQSQQKH